MNTNTFKAPKTSKIINFTQPKSVVDQVKQSMYKKNRMAMLIGSVIGGFVPVATYVIGHHEVQANPMMWMIVAGGLTYSAKSVFDFAKAALKHPAKALGFVALIAKLVPAATALMKISKASAA